MHSWFNPIPAETTLGALAGAVLGSILERHDYLSIPTWVQSFFVIQFVLLIFAFGVAAHFYCAAAFLKKPRIRNVALVGCLLIIISLLFMYPKHLGIMPDSSINFLPHEYNVLMSMVLVMWLVALRLLTAMKKWIED
jgi:peptidoglycan/LPS O-acetylase OafA/YrhL